MNKTTPDAITAASWTDDDQAAAIERGWYLGSSRRIMFHVRDGRFADWNEAMAYVRSSAQAGDPLTRKALAVLAAVNGGEG